MFFKAVFALYFVTIALATAPGSLQPLREAIGKSSENPWTLSTNINHTNIDGREEAYEISELGAPAV